MVFKLWLVLGFIFLASATPLKPSFWKGTPLDSTVEKMKTSCEEKDTIACFQYKAFSFLDTIFQRDNFHLSENVEVTRSQYPTNEALEKADNSLITQIEEYIKSHNVKINFPDIGSVKIDSRGLDEAQIDLNLNFGSTGAVEARKKSKLKKILIPILVFIVLKAITLVPFAIGVLGLKAWNGLQLAFFSFIISTGLAIFQMCQKLATDSAHAHITAVPGPWESVAARNFIDSNKMAYSAYA